MKYDMLTMGGGVWIPPKSDDVIYEQPLMAGKTPSLLMAKVMNYFHFLFGVLP